MHWKVSYFDVDESIAREGEHIRKGRAPCYGLCIGFLKIISSRDPISFRTRSLLDRAVLSFEYCKHRVSMCHRQWPLSFDWYSCPHNESRLFAWRGIEEKDCWRILDRHCRSSNQSTQLRDLRVHPRVSNNEWDYPFAWNGIVEWRWTEGKRERVNEPNTNFIAGEIVAMQPFVLTSDDMCRSYNHRITFDVLIDFKCRTVFHIMRNIARCFIEQNLIQCLDLHRYPSVPIQNRSLLNSQQALFCTWRSSSPVLGISLSLHRDALIRQASQRSSDLPFWSVVKWWTITSVILSRYA